MVKVPGGGALREIDVLFEMEIASYTVRFAIEAKDEGRKLGLLTIEAMIGKYRAKRSPKIDKVVLVSRNGFTREASEKAKANDIELKTLRKIEPADIEALAPMSRATVRFDVAPHVAKLEIKRTDGLALSSEEIKGASFVCGHGKNLGGVLVTVERLKSEAIAIPGIAEQLRKAHDSCGRFCCRVKVPIPHLLSVFNNMKHELESISFHVHAFNAAAKVECESYEMRDAIDPTGIPLVVSRACAEVGGHKFEFVVPLCGTERRGSLKVTPIDGTLP